MRTYAHRGLIQHENIIEYIVKSLDLTDGVEVDVRFNTDREVVLCHDRECRNEDRCERLIELCKTTRPMRMMVDIKAFGTRSAEELARAVVAIVTKHPAHTYELCSFNEYCVQELLNVRMCSRNYVTPYTYAVGMISSGIQMGMYGHLAQLDFVSLNYDVIHEEILAALRMDRRRGIRIYAWTCNDAVVRRDMIHRYKLDGIIYDVLDADLLAHTREVSGHVQPDQAPHRDADGVRPQGGVVDAGPVANDHAHEGPQEGP